MPKLHLPKKRKPYIMAHRGNRVLFPENTLSAFEQAVSEGADIIETDLRVTADGAFVCLHDATLDRTTDGTGPVSEQTLEQARSHNAAALRPDLPSEPIPMIGELAAIIPTGVLLALELKSDSFSDPDVCRRLVGELRQEALDQRTLILSFSTRRLATLRTVDPALPIGWITTNQPWPRSGMELFGPYWPLLFINPMLRLTAQLMGQLVCPLDPTPDGRLGLYRLLGCDAVLSDDPGKTALALGRAPRQRQ